MGLTRYGLREWLSITVASAAAAGGLAWLVAWWWAVAVGAVWLAALWFFRDPVRRVPRNLPPGTMLSPADGTVSAVREVVCHEAVGGPAAVVRIFLSVLNVHVNRCPCDGVVTAIQHSPGRYVNAQREEAAAVNEANLITLETNEGETIGIRQVAGMVARRIVCPLRVGDRLSRGQRFGMIKFGSTAELILPRPGQVTVHVKKGDRVRAGLTRLATLPPKP